ncbi:ATP-dependent DNA helicase RRM3-like protein [Tanacetum coccineum]|uniref:ATP-dependent DNA helicase n=1 Tax=Tanacetum coccineum TaxID=301880 RepID=A0ABQ5B6N7_9ASTR
MQHAVLPTSLLANRDQVKMDAARRKRQTPLNDNSNGINPLLENNVPKITNVATSSSGRVSLTAPKATNVARLVGNHSLPTSGDQITPVAATLKWQTALNDSSRVTPCQTKKVATTPSSVSLTQTPTSGNSIVTPVAAATRNLQSPLTDVSNVALHTPMVGRATQCNKKASTTGVTATIPGIQTRNSTYEVGESSRRPKRSKRPPLQSNTPVRFNLDEADGNVRKVYDKHIGISEEYYDHGDPTFECKECHTLVDDSINRRGRGPYVFRLHGQTYHSMGSLLPKEGAPPKFVQLYIYDTKNEIENRASSLSHSSASSAPSKSKHPVDRDIIRQLKDVLDTLSDLVKTFRRACDRYSEDSKQNIRIKLVAKRGTDERTYNLLTANEVAGLIVGDFDSCVEQRDIVIEKHHEGLERINIFHPFVAKGNTDPMLLGKPVVLSSSFTGRPRNEDSDLYKLVYDFMMHGPCGEDDPTQVCMADGKCTKHFPKKFTEQSSIAQKVILFIEDVITEDMWRRVKFICITVIYLFACEAAWWIFGFETHYRTSFVERLSFHLPGNQTVLYDENFDLETIMHKPSVGQSMFEGWMKINELYPKARDLTYAEFPKKYVWNAPKRIWTVRKKGRSIGRIHSVPISTGDAYYCRMFLNSAKGCRTHDEIKKDVTHWAPPEHLRGLFVTLLSQKELTTPLTVWLQTWHLLAQDVQYKRRQILNIPDLIISDDKKRMLVCYIWKNFCDRETEYERMYASLTTKQNGVYDTIMNSVETRIGGMYFVYGYGGTGKTFLWKTLAAGIRRQGDIVLNVASNSITSFAQSDLGALLKKCKLIIWDEAPMANKHCFEALGRSLRDILRKSRYDTYDHPFGNMKMVFGGDFRQVLSVIPKSSRQDIVSVSLKQSYLWDHCKVLKLTKNIRLTVGARPEYVTEIREFAEWILKFRDGELGEENDDEVEIDVPEEILIDQGSCYC